MDSGACERILGRLTSAFPRPNIEIATVAVWHEHLGRMDFDTAWEACMILERTKIRLPAVADFHEAYGEARAARPGKTLQAPTCGICERGWIIEDPTPGSIHNTVRACPSGCKPWSREQHGAAARFDDYAFQRERAAARRNAEHVDTAGARLPYRDDEPF